MFKLSSTYCRQILHEVSSDFWTQWANYILILCISIIILVIIKSSVSERLIICNMAAVLLL